MTPRKATARLLSRVADVDEVAHAAHQSSTDSGHRRAEAGPVDKVIWISGRSTFPRVTRGQGGQPVTTAPVKVAAQSSIPSHTSHSTLPLMQLATMPFSQALSAPFLRSAQVTSGPSRFSSEHDATKHANTTLSSATRLHRSERTTAAETT